MLRAVIIATGNSAKFQEIKDIMGRYGIVARMSDIKVGVREGTLSYEENARLKASYMTARLGVDAFGEDSGIEVPALGGFPGVISARFIEGTDSGRNSALLDRMRHLGPSDRRAVFKACAVITFVNGAFVAGYGELSGRIIDGPAGENGFGYDPVFVPDGHRRTLAQMSPREKDDISHRRRAVEAVLEKYVAYLKDGIERK